MIPSSTASQTTYASHTKPPFLLALNSDDRRPALICDEDADASSVALYASALPGADRVLVRVGSSGEVKPMSTQPLPAGRAVQWQWHPSDAAQAIALGSDGAL